MSTSPSQSSDDEGYCGKISFSNPLRTKKSAMKIGIWRVDLKALHRVDLLDGERHEQHPDDHGQPDDRPCPGQPDRPVQPGEDLREEVFDGRQDTAEDHAFAFRERWSGKSVWSCA
jgi:hypothetical protein